MDDDEFDLILKQAQEEDRKRTGKSVISKKRERNEGKITEEGQREKAIKKGIEKDNIGFKLLEKMGYKDTIGKTIPKINAPLEIRIRENRVGGLGKEEEEIRMAKSALKEAKARMTMEENTFIEYNRISKELKRKRKQLRGCLKLAFKLDSEKGEDVSSVWSKVYEARERILQSDQMSAEEKEALFEEEEGLTLEELQLNLNASVEYLRETHLYCFWCSVKYNDQEDMDSNCPGKEEDQH